MSLLEYLRLIAHIDGRPRSDRNASPETRRTSPHCYSGERLLHHEAGKAGKTARLLAVRRSSWVPIRFGSGVQIGNQPTFQAGDVIFQQQLALLEPGELQLVAAERVGQVLDGNVEIAVLDTQFGQQMGDLGLVLDLHVGGGSSEIRA